MAKKAVIIKTEQTISTPQQHWNRKEFDDAIQDKGYIAQIERSLRCPCRVKASGQALTSCVNCAGTGWVYIDLQETRLLCSAISNRNKYENWTESNMGTVSITTRPQDKLGWMDKVTLMELESWFTQTLHLRFNRAKTTLFSFLIYKPISVYDVYMFVSDDQPLNRLNDTQYSIEGNKIIVDKNLFTNIQNPSVTIKYSHNPTYYILDINRDLIKQKSGTSCKDLKEIETNFPLHCIGRRAHYVLDQKDFSGNNIIDNTDYSKETPNYDV